MLDLPHVGILEQGKKKLTAEDLIPGGIPTPKALFNKEVTLHLEACLAILETQTPLKEPAVFEVYAPDQIGREVFNSLKPMLMDEYVVSFDDGNHSVAGVQTVTVTPRPELKEMHMVAHYAHRLIQQASRGDARVFQGKTAKTAIRIRDLKYQDETILDQAIALLVEAGWKVSKTEPDDFEFWQLSEGADWLVTIEPPAGIGINTSTHG